MFEVWEKDDGLYLGTFTLDQCFQNPKIRGGILYGFLIAINSEGIVRAA